MGRQQTYGNNKVLKLRHGVFPFPVKFLSILPNQLLTVCLGPVGRVAE